MATTVKSDLMGHSRGPALVDARYDKGAQMVKFKEVIDKLIYALPKVGHFDVESGLAAVADATGLKARHARRRSLRRP